METFWENIKDTIILLLKVLSIFAVIDLILRFTTVGVRIPYIADLIDWALFQVGA